MQGLTDPAERYEVYRRVRRYQANKRRFLAEWAEVTAEAREEVALARELLKQTELSDEAVKVGLDLVAALGIDSHRAEYTMFEAARAYAGSRRARRGRCERHPRCCADGSAAASQ